MTTRAFQPREYTTYECDICNQPALFTGGKALHAWSGSMGLPERPYDHDAVIRKPKDA